MIAALRVSIPALATLSLCSCGSESISPMPLPLLDYTLEALKAVHPAVGVALVLKWPLIVFGIAACTHGFVLVKHETFEEDSDDSQNGD